MKRILLAPSLLAASALGLAGNSLGHGGTYVGPGDLVPPPPANPNPGTPGIGPPGPQTPGAPIPGANGPGPATPPSGPAPRTPGGVGPRTGPGAIDLGPSLEPWPFWWELNRNAFLDLRRRIFGSTVETGSDIYYLLPDGARKQARDVLGPSPELIRRTVVPLLLETLQNEKKRELLDSSMIALAKIGGDQAYVGAIAPFLKDNNQTLVETAAVSLGILAHRSALPLLLGLALDDATGRAAVGRNEVPPRVRAFATYGLGLLAAAVADEAVRRDVAAALLGLLREPRAPSKDVSVAAAISLGLFADPEPGRSIGALLETLDRGGDDLVRAHAPVAAAKALDLAGSPPLEVARCVERFTRAIHERRESERVKESCVLALGLLTNPESPHHAAVVRTLERALEDASGQTRNFAAIALAFAGGEDGAKALRRCLFRGKSAAKPWAGLALGVLAHGEATSKKEARVRDLEGIVDDLSTAMREEKNGEDAAAYGLALGLAGDARHREAVTRRMQEIGGEEARGYFCLALGLLGDREAIEVLHEEAKKALRKPTLLLQAATGLGLLADASAVPELLEMLKGAGTLQGQAALAAALGYVGDHRSVEPLVSMARDEKLTDTARGFAIVALGRIADKEPVPWNAKISAMVNYRAFVPTLVGAGFAPGILDIL